MLSMKYIERGGVAEIFGCSLKHDERLHYAKKNFYNDIQTWNVSLPFFHEIKRLCFPITDKPQTIRF